MKKVVITLLLFLLLVFNLFSLKTNLDAKLKETIEEKEVTITDKYTVRTGDSSDSSYMTGTDGERSYKIVGDCYEIGDVVEIYRNSNSVNAQAQDTSLGDPEWYVSVTMVRRAGMFGVVIFSVFTVVNIAGIILYLRKLVIYRSKAAV